MMCDGRKKNICLLGRFQPMLPLSSHAIHPSTSVAELRRGRERRPSRAFPVRDGGAKILLLHAALSLELLFLNLTALFLIING